MIEARSFIKTHGPWAPIYTFIETKSGKNIKLASGLLRNWTLEHTCEVEHVSIPLSLEYAYSFIEDNAISAERCEELLDRFYKKHEPMEPLLFGEYVGNPDALLIDGHHRYFLAAFFHHNTVPAFMLRREQWEPFMIEGLEDITQSQLRSILPNKRSY